MNTFKNEFAKLQKYRNVIWLSIEDRSFQRYCLN
jgi:hypothetical protein